MKMKSHGPSKSKMMGKAPREYSPKGMMHTAPRAKPGGLNPSGKYSPKKGGGTEGFTSKGGTGMGMSRGGKIDPTRDKSPKGITKPTPREPVRKVGQGLKANLGQWNKQKKGTVLG